MPGEVIRLGGDAVRVTGMRELRAALRRLGDRELLRELGKINGRAAQMVRDRARAKASTAQEAGAASRLRASRGAAKATITLGGKPYDFGAEFGARPNAERRRKSGSYLGLNQFRPWRGNGQGAGYFLFPALRESREQIIEQYVAEIDKLWNREAA